MNLSCSPFFICFILLDVYRLIYSMTNLKHHFKQILLSGPIGCGKIRFVRRILKKRLIDPLSTRLIWVYSEWQEDYDKVRTIYTEV